MQANKPKTLGRQTAKLIAALHDQSKELFGHRDVAKITGLKPGSVRSLVAGLVNRGIATRIKRGLFILVPFELGSEREYLGNPYVVARELAGGGQYYLSHAAAMDIHRMVTQPQLVVYTTTPRAIRPKVVLGTEFRFVQCKPEHYFGFAEEWLTKTEQIRVSDLERTVIDGLKQSEYCGGFTELAKGFWMRRDDMSSDRLVDYALRLDVGAVIRRLGFLLELFDVGATTQVERLQSRLTDTFQLLDPMMPAEGKKLSRWRLRLNVTPEEIESIVRT